MTLSYCSQQLSSSKYFSLLVFSALCLVPNRKDKLPDCFWDAHHWYWTKEQDSTGTGHWSLVLDIGHWCWTRGRTTLALDTGHWYWILVTGTGHRGRTTLVLDTGHCFWTQVRGTDPVKISALHRAPKATTHHTLGTPVPQGSQTAQARQFPPCIKPWGRRKRGKGNTEILCTRPLVTVGLFTTELCDQDWRWGSHLRTGEKKQMLHLWCFPEEGSELPSKLTPPSTLIALKALLCRRGKAQPTGKLPAPLGRVNQAKSQTRDACECTYHFLIAPCRSRGC